jgi:hypothetical protein
MTWAGPVSGVIERGSPTIVARDPRASPEQMIALMSTPKLPPFSFPDYKE